MRSRARARCWAIDSGSPAKADAYYGVVDSLAELAPLVGSDPAQVAREAGQIARDARAGDDWPRLSRAQAILGRAWRMLGEIELAQQALDEAIVAARKAEDDHLAADAHLVLASVLSIAGRRAAAFEQLDIVDRIGSEDLRNAAELQRAALCRDAGMIDESLRLLERLLPRLRREDRPLDAARVLANRGGIRVARGQLAGAISDLHEAEELYRAVGQEFAALQTRHDLACALADLGDLPQALQLFDEVTVKFIELGHDASVPLLSRAEALLRGGLSADALVFSRDAARRLQAEGNRAAAAEALVAVAQAARLEGDSSTAIDAASRARDWFTSSGLTGWERSAELEGMSARAESSGLDTADVDRLEALASLLADDGNVRGELHARALAAVAACRLGELDRGERQAGLAAIAGRRSRLVHPRLVSHHAMATVRLARGDLAGARTHVRRAIDALESSQQLRSAGDAGAAAPAQAASIMLLAGAMAAAETQPMRALAWMERARAAAWRGRPALPPVDDRAAEGFAQLRTVAGDLRRAELAGEPTAELRHRQASLEQSMRSDWLKLGARRAPAAAPPHASRELRQAVGDDQIVSISIGGARLVAVVADRRRARSVALGDWKAVQQSAQQAAGALRSLSAPATSAAVTSTRQRMFSAAVGALDEALLAPLHLDSSNVVLVVPAALHALPWPAMPSLRERSFTLAPSVGWWMDALASPSPAPSSALVVAGPRLAEAEVEARNVAACYGSPQLLLGADASVAAVTTALANHDIVHFVAHGHFRHDNPLWSTIELADGQLTVYELERMGRVPPTVVLATCESGVTVDRGGAQLHGLSATLLTMGARTIVAAIGALPDTEETREVMATLHRDLVSGLGAAVSLARQRQTGGTSSLTLAGLLTLGVG